MEDHPRARRRHQTRVVALRRLKQLRSLTALESGEESALYYAKCSPIGCDCRRRRKGRPKCGAGPCWASHVRPAVRARIDLRRMLADLRAGRIDPDDIPTPKGRRALMQ